MNSGKSVIERKPGSRRRLMGFTLVEMIVVAGIVSAIPSAKYAQVKAKANQTVEINNLRQIGQLLVMHQIDNRAYPKAAFYPKDPFNGADSIRVILAGKGGKPQVKSRGGSGLGGIAGRIGGGGNTGGVGGMFVASAMPSALQQKGLTYVYNDAIAGKRNLSNPGRTWVLIDMTCVSRKVAPPYRNGYNILFADGHVLTTKKLPPSIVKLRGQVK